MLEDTWQDNIKLSGQYLKRTILNIQISKCSICFKLLDFGNIKSNCFLSYKNIPVKRSPIARTMNQVIWNLSGKRMALRMAVNMFAVAELYSFTTLSSLLRMAATTRPPILPKRRPSTRKSLTLFETCESCSTMVLGRRLATEATWTIPATPMPQKYNQNCCSRKFSPEF